MRTLVTARRRPLRATHVQDSDYFAFEGGLNLVDTPLKLRPGQLLATKNYEPGVRGGYRSVKGYERLDGRPEPSQANYWILNYERATSVPGIGVELTGAAANAIVLAVVEQQPVSVVNLASGSDALSTWTPFGSATVATNVFPHPIDGNATADRITEPAGIATSGVSRTFAKATDALTYWASWYVHANGRSRGVLTLGSPTVSGNRAQVNFDLFNRAIGAAVATGDFVARGQYLEAIGSGWFRIGLLFTSNTEASVVASLTLADSAGSTTYVGDGASGMIVAGFQLELSAVSSTAPSGYVPTDARARGNGTGYVVLARLDGSYTNEENLAVAGEVWSSARGEELPAAADTDELNQEYAALAIADARAQIEAVPGAGPILGTAVYNGTVYAFRNATDGNSARMFKATGLGWSPINLGTKLRFDAGLAEIQEGATIVGATSGAFAIVHRIIKQSGTWGSDAAGYIVTQTVTGTFQDNEVLNVNSTASASVNGPATPQALGANGQFEFRVHNFYGHTGRRRLYGVDGVSRGFEYQDNPEFFVQIETGMTVDTPNHLGVHDTSLWLSFPGGSVQRSGAGDPVIWQVALGANELGVGDEVTGFQEEIGDTLFVYCRNSTHYVLGNVADGYALKTYNKEVGALAGTVQRMGQGMALDDRGFATLGSTQKYGNYNYNSVSALIQPLIEQLKDLAVTSVTVKDDNLYRLFLSDGRFLSIGIHDKKITGFMMCEYPHVVRCTFAGEDASGKQLIVFGSDDGFVYRAERGTSFDGAEIETFMRPVYFFSRSPSRRKRYRRAQFDIRVTGDLTLDIAVDYSFGDADDPAEAVREIQLGGGGGIYGQAIWGQFKWGAGQAPEAIVKLEGSGINVGFLLASRSATATPHSIEGVALQHSVRRMNRGTSYA